MEISRRPHIIKNADIDLELGERIRIYRKMAWMSQAHLGEMVGVTFQQIQKYVRGANRVAVSTLISICKILKIELVDMLDGLGEGAIDRSRRQTLANRLADAEMRLAEIYKIAGANRVAVVDPANELLVEIE